MKSKRVLAAALLLSLSLVACEQKVSKDNFDRVQAGMNIDEVEKFLGKGEVQDEGGTSIGSGGLTGGSSHNSQKTYHWETPGKEISVTVDADGKVLTKNSRGL